MLVANECVEKCFSFLVLTDSQSLCTSFLGISVSLDLVRFKLADLRRENHTLDLSYHSNLLENEIADFLSKQAFSENAQTYIITYA